MRIAISNKMGVLNVKMVDETAVDCIYITKFSETDTYLQYRNQFKVTRIYIDLVFY